MASVIDGRTIASGIERDVAREVRVLLEQGSVAPGLAVILVGEDPASDIYVRRKVRKTIE